MPVTSEVELRLSPYYLLARPRELRLNRGRILMFVEWLSWCLVSFVGGDPIEHATGSHPLLCCGRWRY